MSQELLNKVSYYTSWYHSLETRQQYLENQVSVATAKMDEIMKEQELIERAVVAIQQAKPLLSVSSIKQCESLANAAISSVFDLPYTVEYNPETQRFLLNKGDYKTDLADSEGGGIASVIGFIFNLFLLVKLGKRRFLIYDEAFYAISEQYLPNFIQFVRKVCDDLGVDILSISHDPRWSLDDVDSCYLIEDGKAKKLK